MSMYYSDDEDIVTMKSVRDELAKEIPSLANFQASLMNEIVDPEIELFRNIRHLSLSDWDNFNVHTGTFEKTVDVASSQTTMSKKKMRKVHKPRSYHYKIGNFKTSPYYLNYLSDEIIQIPGGREDTVRNHMKKISSNPKSYFRSWFKMPLAKIEKLATMVVDADIVHLSHHCRTQEVLKVKSELLVLGALATLAGSISGFRQLHVVTHICPTDHSQFFLRFVKFLYDIRDEYIYLPRNDLEQKEIMSRYEEMGLPGAMGSVDVVHVKWSNCPSGDFNRAKGKQSYPSLAFECNSDFDRRFLSVHGPHFGTRNDKHIVKMDESVALIAIDYADVKWKCFDEYGNIRQETGAYLICDNGYLQWPTLMCPFMRSEGNTNLEQFFSTNLESVRKDVECTFGILKARWKSLDSGFKYRRIQVCKHIFVACCVLHNMMLDEMVREEPPPRIGRGCRMPKDGIWLEGPTVQCTSNNLDASSRMLKIKFHRLRNMLAHHLWVWKSKCKNGEIVPLQPLS